MGYSKDVIVDFATHSSDATTSEYYLKGDGYLEVNNRRQQLLARKSQINFLPQLLEQELPYFDKHGKLVPPSRPLNHSMYSKYYQDELV